MTDPNQPTVLYKGMGARMLVRDEVAWPILEMAIGHGLADNLMQTELAQSDALDLINRLLLTDAIDSSKAVALINAVMSQAET